MVNDNARRCFGSLRALMSHKDGAEYARDVEFTQEQLLEISADDVVAFFNCKAHGTENPGPDDRPTNGRANALLDHKKAISLFMPNRNHKHLPY